MSSRSKIVTWACLVGFVGDAVLQLLVKNGYGQNWGLSSYFAQHGKYESMCVAAGMMGLFYSFYVLSPLPLKPLPIIILAILVDLAFRKWNIFPSLQSYYQSFGYIKSAIWAIIPLLLPWVLFRLFP